YAVPLGASTPLGALGYVRAVGELVSQGMVPDAIVVASSSGGTLAGLLAGIELHALATRVYAISADDPSAAVTATVRTILDGVGRVLGGAGAVGGRPGDRSRRLVRGRWLRHPHAGVGGGSHAGGADRGAVSRPDIHGQGDGRAHRPLQNRTVSRGRNRPVLAH